jgi:hypothetical protein
MLGAEAPPRYEYSFTPEGGLGLALQVYRDVVAHVDGDVSDCRPGEGEGGFICRGDGLTAVAPDVGALTPQREIQRLDSQISGGDDVASGVEVCRSSG